MFSAHLGCRLAREGRGGCGGINPTCTHGIITPLAVEEKVWHLVGYLPPREIYDMCQI